MLGFGAPTKLKPRVDRNLLPEAALAEYRELAEEVGISDADVLIEEFRIFLAKQDYPTFNLKEVVAYMDEIAAKDNPTKLGWHWCPVREKDTVVPMRFGRPSTKYTRLMSMERLDGPDVPSSDFYMSHQHSQRPNSTHIPNLTIPRWSIVGHFRFTLLRRLRQLSVGLVLGRRCFWLLIMW
jgi:hypothetical protein